MAIDLMEVDMYMTYSNIFDIYHHRWGIIYDVWCVDHINIYHIKTCHICDQVCSITVLTSYNDHLYIRHFCVDHTYNIYICMISTSYIYDSSSLMVDSWHCFFYRCSMMIAIDLYVIPLKAMIYNVWYMKTI